MKVALRCYVSGRVQGVYFRASAQQRARELGVTGYAHNLPDGRVEVLACGESAALEAFVEWLWQGPSQAQVDDVATETLPLEQVADDHRRTFATG